MESSPESFTPELTEQQLTEIARVLKETQGKAMVSQYESTLSKLFMIVPELESIQKNARLKVL
jgi:hypothetical protein